MKALHLVHSNQRRGAETFAYQLMQALQRFGSDHRAVALNWLPDAGDGTALAATDVFSGLDLLAGRQGLARMLPGPFKRAAQVVKLVQDMRPDVVVAHGGDTLKVAALASLRARRPRYIYRNIGLASDWASGRARRNLNRLFLRRMHSVISVSDFTREDFSGYYALDQDRVRMIPNGVNSAPFAPDRLASLRKSMRAELRVGEAEILLISVGALDDAKDPLTTFEIVRRLVKTGVPVKLVMAGAGPLLETLKDMARQPDLQGVVTMLGARPDVPELLAAADVFIMTSRSEGMPAVLVEAGLASLSTVCFDVGAVGEVVTDQETGMLAPPGDIDLFVSQVRGLAEDPRKRAAMGESARERCSERFTMEVVARQYEDFLSGVAGTR